MHFISKHSIWCYFMFNIFFQTLECYFFECTCKFCVHDKNHVSISKVHYDFFSFWNLSIFAHTNFIKVHCKMDNFNIDFFKRWIWLSNRIVRFLTLHVKFIWNLCEYIYLCFHHFGGFSHVQNVNEMVKGWQAWKVVEKQVLVWHQSQKYLNFAKHMFDNYSMEYC